tara:strand:- start:7370 stop:8350 length:981 start_codon:yes stop_codon:yes gene_type:complete
MSTKKKNRVLIIDALNMYFRSYIVDPSLSANGQPIGGVKGFLKILQKLIRETKPDGIVVAWDGPGGSRKRKAVNKGYKEGRKPIRLNREIRNLSENEELKNKVWQQTRLAEYLNELPIIQLMLPEVEADDIISFLIQSSHLKGTQKVIVSSDKDFFQLCDDETVLFRPVQKEVLNKKAVLERFDIHPTNFALARAICGDKSDNLKGIPGAGLKTIAKRFPFFKEKKDCTLDQVIDACESVDSDLKIYKSILGGAEVIKENYKIMQLYSPLISVQGKQKIKSIVENFKCEFNKTEVICMMNEDGFGVYDWTGLFTTMKRFCLTTEEK